MIHILAVASKRELRRHICAAMRVEGYECSEAENAEEAMTVLGREAIQLIVADYESGGCELTAELREAGDAMPVIVIVPLISRGEKRRVFRTGADGYMPLPLDEEELQMRVENLLWRCNIVSDSVLRIGSCELRSSTLQLVTPDGAIDLRRMEFLLLQKLLSYPGRIFTRAQLMDELWGYDSESEPRTVDTHVKLLRKKLRSVDEIRIQTVRGLGYRAVLPRRTRDGG